MSKVHDFEKSLKQGKKAENDFYELFKDKVEKLDGYISDFAIKKNGKKIELKCDNYDPTKTQNFFIEKYSYDEVPGGPEQALVKGSDYFIYWFPITMEFFVFKTKELENWLNKNYPEPYLINIRNKNHVTRGYTVPRHKLEDIKLNLEDIL